MELCTCVRHLRLWVAAMTLFFRCHVLPHEGTRQSPRPCPSPVTLLVAPACPPSRSWRERSPCRARPARERGRRSGQGKRLVRRPGPQARADHLKRPKSCELKRPEDWARPEVRESGRAVVAARGACVSRRSRMSRLGSAAGGPDPSGGRGASARPFYMPRGSDLIMASGSGGAEFSTF